MAEPKTKLNDAPVAAFIDAIPDEQTRRDCWKIIDLMQAAAKAPPQLWGSSIVGFGVHPILYANGRTADWPLIAFSPRKQNLTLYGLTGSAAYDALSAQLGKHTCGKGCLYIKRLSEVDLAALEKLIRAAVENKQPSGGPA